MLSIGEKNSANSILNDTYSVSLPFSLYCTEKLSTFSSLVQHLMEQHHDKEIKFKLSEGKLLRTLNFKIIPEL
jgi:hypothetical protein